MALTGLSGILQKTVICNMHYLNFKTPSRPDNNVIPIYFKRPRSDPTTNYVPKKRRLLQRANRGVENLSTRSTDNSQTEQYLQQYTEGHDDSQDEWDSQQYIEGQDDSQAEQDSQQYVYIEGQDDSPQAEQQHSHNVGQDNSIVEACERPESQAAVNPVTLNSMEDIQQEN